MTLEERLILALAADEGPAHLQYEQLAAYADGSADAIDREIAESHASMCARCSAELEDLRTFAAAAPPKRAWLVAAAAAILAVIALLIAPKHDTFTLHDNGREVRLTPADEQRIVAALSRVKPERRTPSSAMRGSASPADAFEPLSPIGCVVVSDRPTFEWTAVPGARYKVEVFGEHFRPLAASDLLDTTRWTAPEPLARGGTYAWQVTAFHGTSETTAPAPPAPVARFVVLDAVHARDLANLERQQPRSHLALGVAYAEAGARAEATREIRALAAENRDSAVAKALLRAVEQAR